MLTKKKKKFKTRDKICDWIAYTVRHNRARAIKNT